MSRKRRQNEKEFDEWKELENGGWLYIKTIIAGDNSGKKACYEKTVDENDKTISFVQKIYDKDDNLLEIHEKYPIDKGHIILSLFVLLLAGVLTYNYIIA